MKDTIDVIDNAPSSFWLLAVAHGTDVTDLMMMERDIVGELNLSTIQGPTGVCLYTDRDSAQKAADGFRVRRPGLNIWVDGSYHQHA